MLFFYGEHPFLFLFVMPIAILILALSWIAIFLTYGVFIKIICLFLLFFLVRYIISNTIFKIYFKNDCVSVKYLFFKEFDIEYSQISKFCEHQEGFIPVKFVLIFFKSNAFKKKKVHFFCPLYMREELDSFLREKGFGITK